HEKEILATWRKLIMGARVIERIREEYISSDQRDEINPFTRQRFGSTASALAEPPSPIASPSHDDQQQSDDGLSGGGFVLSDED
ncbi:hypothetical protein KEM52_003437, partial [Ascosphaera acerosa]